MNVSMCQICKDSIWSFICPHCLANAIEKWLPPYLRDDFGKFSDDFFRSFSTTIDMDGLMCLRCRKIRLANICPWCFLNEVYDWLREKDASLANTVAHALPLGTDWKHHHDDTRHYNNIIVPITASENPLRDEGLCETCESYSQELVHYDGRWVCKDCESLER